MYGKPSIFVALVLAGSGLSLLAFARAANAQAEPFYCDQMRAEYAALAREAETSRANVSAGRVASVRRELVQAQMAAQRNNCTRFLFARPSPACPRIMSEIQRLQNQLARSGGNVFGFRRLFAERDPAFERDRVRDMLRVNGCGVPDRAGTRTVCVRTCDGYYFPISFRASPARYRIDAAVCQSMYAEDGQAELYVAPGSADISRAKSLDGKTYGQQPFAFAFRSTYDKACATELHTGLAALGKRYADVRLKRRGAPGARIARPVPTPLPRPSQFEDPETLANLEGGLIIRRLVNDAVAMNAKPVRIIGPAYYADLFDLTRPPQPSRFDFGIIGSAKADELRPTVESADLPAGERQPPAEEP
jgi:hypothetical protein